MNNIRPGLFDQPLRFRKRLRNIESLAKLICHQWFAITSADQASLRNEHDLLRVLVRDLAATDDAHFQHDFIPFVTNSKYRLDASAKATDGVQPRPSRS